MEKPGSIGDASLEKEEDCLYQSEAVNNLTALQRFWVYFREQNFRQSFRQIFLWKTFQDGMLSTKWYTRRNLKIRPYSLP